MLQQVSLLQLATCSLHTQVELLTQQVQQLSVQLFNAFSRSSFAFITSPS
ncbi:hypothetical protein A0R60_3703 [Enterobacter asburiae]|nr:hypothetical protein A0R60_3703 [Enterobacter asburiae]